MENKNLELNPNWITGFVDAEGCFYVRFVKSNSYKTGWLVQACFQLGVHNRDLELLLLIKSFFKGVGSIYGNDKGKYVLYQVRNLDDILRVIIPHFDKYPLIGEKYNNYLLFKNIVNLMNNKEHLNKEGLNKIISYKSSLNKGITEDLKISFPNIKKAKLLDMNIANNINPYWIAGFFTGEGCFFTSRNTVRVDIAQHSRNRNLILSLKNTLGCGVLYEKYVNVTVLRISKLEDIYRIIIPLFNKYSIKGIKAMDYNDFCIIAELIYNKDHLTPEGYIKIKNIKNGMNKSRKFQGKVVIGRIRYLLNIVYKHLGVRLTSFPYRKIV